MIEWRAGSRLGKILFATGIAGCVLLGRTLGGRRRILVGILGWGAAGPIVFLLLANMFGRVQAGTRQAPAS